MFNGGKFIFIHFVSSHSMFYGIVVHFFIKAVKHAVLYLFCISNTVLFLQIKVCIVVVSPRRWLVHFMAYNAYIFKIIVGRKDNSCRTKATKKSFPML